MRLRLVPLNEDRIVENRRVRKWKPKEIAGELLWAWLRLCFVGHLRNGLGWASLDVCVVSVLRLRMIVNVDPSVTDLHSLESDDSRIGPRCFDPVLYIGSLTIGRRVTVSTTEHSRRRHPRTIATRPLPLGKSCHFHWRRRWVCADSFIGSMVVSIEEEPSLRLDRL